MEKTFKHVFEYLKETKGTWVYEVKLAPGHRVSGSNQIYILKSDYPTKPCSKVEVTYLLQD